MTRFVSSIVSCVVSCLSGALSNSATYKEPRTGGTAPHPNAGGIFEVQNESSFYVNERHKVSDETRRAK